MLKFLEFQIGESKKCQFVDKVFKYLFKTSLGSYFLALSRFQKFWKLTLTTFYPLKTTFQTEKYLKIILLYLSICKFVEMNLEWVSSMLRISFFNFVHDYVYKLTKSLVLNICNSEDKIKYVSYDIWKYSWWLHTFEPKRFIENRKIEKSKDQKIIFWSNEKLIC